MRKVEGIWICLSSCHLWWQFWIQTRIWSNILNIKSKISESKCISVLLFCIKTKTCNTKHIYYLPASLHKHKQNKMTTWTIFTAHFIMLEMSENRRLWDDRSEIIECVWIIPNRIWPLHPERALWPQYYAISTIHAYTYCCFKLLPIYVISA